MSRSWGHTCWRLSEDEIERARGAAERRRARGSRHWRYEITCKAHRDCEAEPTHATNWQYVTGRAGRVSDQTRRVCTEHATRYAEKHRIEIMDERPDFTTRREANAQAFMAATERWP